MYSVNGYRRYSRDVDNAFNIIPSDRISMKGVDFPVIGVDEFGIIQFMQPEKEYQFPGNTVFEVPIMERGGWLPSRDKVKAILNPKNWGVPDYSDKGSKDAAYVAARKAGEKEFMWNNIRFNTLNSGTPTQQFNMYGNTNAMVMSKADDKTKEKIFKNSFVGNSMDAEELERRFTLNTLVGTPSYRDCATHPIQEEAYAKFRKQPLEKSKSELMDEYRKIGSSKIRPRFNAFTNTIYGNSTTAEEAHAYRNTEKSEIISFIKDYIKYPFFTEGQQLAAYTNRDHFEFDTHSIVEPVLESYLSGEIEKEDIPIYIKKLREQNQKYLSNKNNLKNTFNTDDLKPFYPYTEKSNKYKIQGLQKTLSEKGYKLPKSTKKDGTFDGVWGEETENALIDWQNKTLRTSQQKYQQGGTVRMDGMMKARLALDSHFGNSTARRMTNYDTRNYKFDDGSVGNVYVSSYDNLVTPHIQLDENNNLIYVDDIWSDNNKERSYQQSMKFEREEDAEYFGKNYKRVAPMKKLYQDGGYVQEEDPTTQLLYSIAEALQQGNDPREVLNALKQNGVPEEQAMELIKYVMEQIQQQDQLQKDEKQQLEYAQDGKIVRKYNVEDLDWSKGINRAMLAFNMLQTPGLWHVPVKHGVLDALNAGLGLAAGLSGVGLGYSKLGAKKEYLGAKGLEPMKKLTTSEVVQTPEITAKNMTYRPIDPTIPLGVKGLEPMKKLTTSEVAQTPEITAENMTSRPTEPTIQSDSGMSFFEDFLPDNIKQQYNAHFGKQLSDFINANSENINTLYPNIDLDTKQDGGYVQEEDPTTQLLYSIAEALQQGSDPREVLNALKQNGVPEEQAMELIKYVMEQMQQQDQLQKEEKQQLEYAQDGKIVRKPTSENLTWDWQTQYPDLTAANMTGKASYTVPNKDNTVNNWYNAPGQNTIGPVEFQKGGMKKYQQGDQVMDMTSMNQTNSEFLNPEVFNITFNSMYPYLKNIQPSITAQQEQNKPYKDPWDIDYNVNYYRAIRQYEQDQMDYYTDLYNKQHPENQQKPFKVIEDDSYTSYYDKNSRKKQYDHFKFLYDNIDFDDFNKEFEDPNAEIKFQAARRADWDVQENYKRRMLSSNMQLPKNDFNNEQSQGNQFSLFDYTIPIAKYVANAQNIGNMDFTGNSMMNDGRGLNFSNPSNPSNKTSEQLKKEKQNKPKDNSTITSMNDDALGFMIANNALIGFQNFNDYLSDKDYEREYNRRMMQIGNTNAKYNPVNYDNPYGTYTPNVGIGSNYGLVANGPIQDFGTGMFMAEEGGRLPQMPRGGIVTDKTVDSDREKTVDVSNKKSNKTSGFLGKIAETVQYLDEPLIGKPYYFNGKPYEYNPEVREGKKLVFIASDPDNKIKQLDVDIVDFNKALNKDQIINNYYQKYYLYDNKPDLSKLKLERYYVSDNKENAKSYKDPDLYTFRGKGSEYKVPTFDVDYMVEGHMDRVIQKDGKLYYLYKSYLDDIPYFERKPRYNDIPKNFNPFFETLEQSDMEYKVGFKSVPKVYAIPLDRNYKFTSDEVKIFDENDLRNTRVAHNPFAKKEEEIVEEEPINTNKTTTTTQSSSKNNTSGKSTAQKKNDIMYNPKWEDAYF